MASAGASAGHILLQNVEYSDRRVPKELREDAVLWGECISGALYWNVQRPNMEAFFNKNEFLRTKCFCHQNGPPYAFCRYRMTAV